jgi:hypothetical protein
MRKLPLFILAVAVALFSCGRNRIMVPVVDGEPWKICSVPDLGPLNGPDPVRQQVVDHGFFQAGDGSWQCWACIRGTAVGRILYGWQGESLTGPMFESTGIVVRADSAYGEQVQPEEKIQAPFFMRSDTGYYCFYNSNGLRVMFSKDGCHFRKIGFNEGSNLVFEQSGRDVMVLEDGGTYYAYSAVSTVTRDNWPGGFIVVRTSPDLRRWSDYTIVSAGGIAGNGPVSAESPFVLKRNGLYYLFRSSSITGRCYVYASDTPYHFGINDDSKLVTVLPVRAPEIVFDRGIWYISDLADFSCIRLCRLVWKRE